TDGTIHEGWVIVISFAAASVTVFTIPPGFETSANVVVRSWLLTISRKSGGNGENRLFNPRRPRCGATIPCCRRIGLRRFLSARDGLLCCRRPCSGQLSALATSG